ncbi:MAG TPA: hypothetical protein VFH78_08745 [Candidatus Thermoplasmatota archaeon]|nr:hypothetical protein [Candidatus Thermoplasmatota archaeon]
MPRAVQLPLVLLLALVSLAPATVGAPLVTDVLHATGAATSFQVFGAGYAVEGAPYQWNDVCAGCSLRITVREGTFLVVDPDGGTRALNPGQYEVREFRGLFMFSQMAPRDFHFQLHGIGKLIAIK